MKVRALVVDDESPARKKIRRLLSEDHRFTVVGEAENGEQAVEAIENLRPDVVFLDIHMPGMSGLEVIDYLTPPLPRIVFVTAHDSHAVTAFEKRALDYLLKPVITTRFRQTLDRLSIELEDAHGRRDEAIRSLRAGTGSGFLTRILVHDGSRIVLLAVDRISYVEAQRNELHFVASGHRYTERGTLRALEARLDPRRFLRINRSQIVRLDAIAGLQPWSHGDYRVVLADGTVLSWSRRMRAGQKGLFSLQPMP